MSTQQVKKCINCHWWDKSACHIKAPTRNLNGSACFPSTGPTEWCGEWFEAPQEAVQARKEALTSQVVTPPPVPEEHRESKPGTFDLDLSSNIGG